LLTELGEDGGKIAESLARLFVEVDSVLCAGARPPSFFERDKEEENLQRLCPILSDPG